MQAMLISKRKLLGEKPVQNQAAKKSKKPSGLA